MKKMGLKCSDSLKLSNFMGQRIPAHIIIRFQQHYKLFVDHLLERVWSSLQLEWMPVHTGPPSLQQYSCLHYVCERMPVHDGPSSLLMPALCVWKDACPWWTIFTTNACTMWVTLAAAANSAPSVGCPRSPSGVISALLHTQPICPHIPANQTRNTYTVFITVVTRYFIKHKGHNWGSVSHSLTQVF